MIYHIPPHLLHAPIVPTISTKQANVLLEIPWMLKPSEGWRSKSKEQNQFCFNPPPPKLTNSMKFTKFTWKKNVFSSLPPLPNYLNEIHPRWVDADQCIPSAIKEIQPMFNTKKKHKKKYKNFISNLLHDAMYPINSVIQPPCFLETFRIDSIQFDTFVIVFSLNLPPPPILPRSWPFNPSTEGQKLAKINQSDVKKAFKAMLDSRHFLFLSLSFSLLTVRYDTSRNIKKSCLLS